MKTILITGVSSGIGFETALFFARKGWNVIGAVRQKSGDLDRIEQIAQKEHLHIKTIKCDVTNQSDIDNITRQLDKIDVLVNNAGFGFLGPVETFSIDEVKEQYETNLFGMIRMIKALVPTMRKQGRGIIINISSVNGLVSFPIYGIYSSSKFAMETISEALRFELRPFGIKVVIVEPGYFATRFSDNVRFAKDIAKSPYERWVTKTRERLVNNLSRNNRLMKKLSEPQRVASLLYTIANKPDPKVRYKIGLDTYVFSFAKNILPYTIWTSLINKVYRWNSNNI